MNPFEFVLALVFLVGMFTLFSKTKGRSGGMDWGQDDEAGDEEETIALRKEVRALKDRIKVLERITVEKENSLAREIEELRDR